MAGIVEGVETDQVAMEHTPQKVRADGQNAVDLAAGEGRVQEETDGDVLLALGAELAAQHFRQEHQVIVVHPHHVSVPHLVGDRLRKEPVGFLIRLPGRFIEHDLPWVVVEERPED